MKRIVSLFLAVCLTAEGYSQAFSQTINPVIGDQSFIQSFGIRPGAATDEQLRIQTHLRFVEQKLRSEKDKRLSRRQQIKREKILNLLHEYWTRGVFPSNFDYPDERRPCFIDRDGKICAVGYLIEKTLGID